MGPFGSRDFRRSRPRTAGITTTRHMLIDSAAAFVPRAAEPRDDLVAPLVRPDEAVAVAGNPQVRLGLGAAADQVGLVQHRHDPNSKITKVTTRPDRPEGTVMTVEFELDGEPFVALNGGPQFSFSEATSSRSTATRRPRRGRRGGPVRVAQGPLRPFLADHPVRASAPPERSRPREGAARHGLHDEDRQARGRRAGARSGGRRRLDVARRPGSRPGRRRARPRPPRG